MATTLRCIVRSCIFSSLFLLVFFNTIYLSFPEISSAQDKKISLQFRNVNIHDVFTSLSKQGNMKIVSSKTVQGNVTIFVDNVGVMQALSLVVESQGLAYYRANGIVRVMTADEYSQRFGKPFRGQLTTQVLRLQHAAAEQVVKSVFQLKSKDGNIVADPRSNSVILVDYPGIVRDMVAIIKQLDVATEARTYSLNHLPAQSIGEIIKSMVSSGGKVQIDAGTNEILIIDAPERLERVEAYIQQADVPADANLKIIPLQYADPEAVMNQIKDELTPGFGSVKADKATSQLFVRDLPSNMPYLEQLIAALDQKTREVLIEAKIIQITLTDSYKMGVDWDVLTSRLNGVIEAGSSFRILGDTDSGVRLKATALKSGKYTFTALLEALQSVGKTDLLSNPRITCVDGVEAKILVGSTVPYKTFDTREDQGVLKTFEKVITVDVGVKLFVTPIINEDGFITMKIKPEVSEVTSFIDNVPVIDKSETETTVLVKDGVTIVIGGLIKDQNINTVDKVPILGDIPLLGLPFRKKNVQKIKSELVILLRPQIISGDVDMSYSSH
ncbi:MAG: secretin N-terminal domain-containing protein [bacterium]